jgi:hypothetical protein
MHSWFLWNADRGAIAIGGPCKRRTRDERKGHTSLRDDLDLNLQLPTTGL